MGYIPELFILRKPVFTAEKNIQAKMGNIALVNAGIFLSAKPISVNIAINNFIINLVKKVNASVAMNALGLLQSNLNY